VHSWYVSKHKEVILFSFLGTYVNCVLLYTLCNTQGEQMAAKKLEEKEGRQVTALLQQAEELCLRLSTSERRAKAAQDELERMQQSMAQLQARSAADLQAMQLKLAQAAKLQEAAKQGTMGDSVDIDRLAEMVVGSIKHAHRGWCSQFTTGQSSTRSKLAKAQADALNQVEDYLDEYSNCFLSAKSKVNSKKPAEEELDAMDDAYFRFTLCMHECSRLASALR
jgi:hypothetical protein